MCRYASLTPIDSYKGQKMADKNDLFINLVMLIL